MNGHGGKHEKALIIHWLQQKRWQKRADGDSVYRGSWMGLMHTIDDTTERLRVYVLWGGGGSSCIDPINLLGGP
jgi:hypothetical protein